MEIAAEIETSLCSAKHHYTWYIVARQKWFDSASLSFELYDSIDSPAYLNWLCTYSEMM